ncbi:MAG: BglG family transcription antiterminator [Lachnospiraceae bacterium]|nr:BglG family transcription antiterminator [Lachnospiraceae bacterium]
MRTLIKEVNHSLLSHGAEVVRRRGIGYRLEIKNEAVFASFLNKIEEEEKSGTIIPATPSERVQYILGLLLQADHYMKLDEISDMLYISKRVISDDLKEVEQILNGYHLKLMRRANYGVRITGDEPSYRRCLIECVFENQMRPLKNDAERELDQIAGLVRKSVEEHNLTMSEIAIRNLVIHIYAAICRVRNLHFTAENCRFDKTQYGENFQIACQIADVIKEMFDIDFPESEIGYITVRLAGLQTLNEKAGNENNLIVTQEISDLVTEMLEKVNEAFQIDFSNNLELRMSLSQHIVPMQVRIQFGLKLNNPLLIDIKKKFALAYAMAGQACTVINRHFDTQLSDDEIGYIALVFALALESRKKKPEGKNVLVVCGTGKGSARLLKYKYQQEFGDYIRHIEICDVNEIDKINFQNFDYLFTTVTIPIAVPIPIQEVNVFLGQSDISRIKRVLSEEAGSGMKQYIFPELFLPELDQKSKEEVLKAMCTIAEQQGFVEDDFYEAVLRREQLANTDYGELVAMPHPDRCVSKKTFVCVGILKEPVFWGKQNVQVIFLMAISDRPDKRLQTFYQTIARYLLDEKQIQELIEKRDYQEFVHQLSCVEEEVRNGGN